MGIDYPDNAEAQSRVSLALPIVWQSYDNWSMSEEGPVSEDDQTGEKKPWPCCGNCGKAAYALLNQYPVCIDCKYKVDMSQWMEFVKNATMMNFASQQMDDLIGFGPRSPTIQIPKPPVPPINYNNQTVSISGGVVGSINFGSVHEIQVNLQTLSERGSQSIVEPLTKLTGAIINAQDANEITKNELLEQVAALTNLANAKPEERKLGMVKALFGAIKEGSSAIGSAAGTWAIVEPLLKGHFGF